jgi:hypothetical protein
MTEPMAFYQDSTEVVQRANEEVTHARTLGIFVVTLQEIEQALRQSLGLFLRVTDIGP